MLRYNEYKICFEFDDGHNLSSRLVLAVPKIVKNISTIYLIDYL